MRGHTAISKMVVGCCLKKPPETIIVFADDKTEKEDAYRYIEKKYLNTGGYVTGLQLANKYGFTTQNPSCYEVCSNEATTKQRKQTVDGNTIIVYKPVTDITKKNKPALQFLDLMSVIDKYSEITGEELVAKLKKYVEAVKVDFSVVKELLPLYPDKVYRNIYEGGLMGELV